jgi:drug/metabolite transporter (DMT)-like permease
MKKGRKMIIDILVLVFISMTLGSFGQVYIKMGLRNIGSFDLADIVTTKLVSVLTNKNVILGLVFYGVATLLWFVVLAKSELSYAYPLIGLSYAVTAILARFYFNETISVIRWAGIFAIIFGAFLITRS